MPIYSYRCEQCGHRQDVLQKMSDTPLTVCPSCGESTFRKQVTAAGFQLKGSGWYVTDFRSPPAPAGAKKSDEATAAAPGEPAPAGADPKPSAKPSDAPASPAPSATAPTPKTGPSTD